MKILLILILSILFTFSAYAAELNQKALQGDRLVVEFMGNPNKDRDIWQFSGNKFYQKLGVLNASPDEFNASSGVIDLGYGKITVTSFNGKTMQAIMAGFKYKLIKQ